MTKEVYLGLGSNIEDREKFLIDAIILLKNHDRISVNDLSSIYETEPVGYLEQDKFLNCVLLISTDLEPYDLLEVIHKVESDLNRKREIHWGPRTIDIDILLYDNIKIEEKDLIIPHKEMWGRGFVLLPLQEIYAHNLVLKDKIDRSIEKISTEGITIYKRKNTLKTIID